MLIVFRSATGQHYEATAAVVPSGKWSSVRNACVDCARGNYEYRVYRNDGTNWVEAQRLGGPTEPQVSVE